MELLSKDGKQSKNMSVSAGAEQPVEAPQTDALLPGQDEQPFSAEDIVLEEI
jgi:hypothetical protein